ncbi:hypothetical protein NC797_15515 [Aquibacillus sp. 3ASR75-11]|uniref:Uncharacterized protein n=1 Tax=Terrihalobacillus insolitus TaxID=2950438 RepID=A0A9X3WWN1_9BACI|nr:hypothetical protein [Terrihalobacillus insolitus]MDC3425913.1 hypothetical protein [Terrihalobacillus insolitus]
MKSLISVILGVIVVEFIYYLFTNEFEAKTFFVLILGIIGGYYIRGNKKNES